MRLPQLVEAAGRFYPEDFVMRHFDPVRRRVRRLRAGDTLAELIVGELVETYEPASGDEAQVAEAIRVLEQAKRDLESSLHGLRELGSLMALPGKE